MQDLVAGEAKRPVVVETRKRRVVTPQERGAITRRGNQAAAGETTATTPAEAAAQLQTQLAEDNRDVLEPLAKELVEDEAPVERNVIRTGKLKDAIRGLMLGANLTGVHRLMMNEAANRIRKLAGDVPIHVMDHESFQAAAKDRYPPGRDTSRIRAFYDHRTDEIFTDETHLSAEMVVHEGLHATYHRAIEADPKVRSYIYSLMQAVHEKLSDEARAEGRDTYRVPYGLRNPHEFISEAFSNPEFIALLERTPYSTRAESQNRGLTTPRGMSTWHALILSIKQALFGKGGPSPNILEQIVRATHILDTAVQSQGRVGLRESDLLPMEFNVGDTLANVRAAANDRGAGAAKWWQGTAIKGMAVNQIVTVFAKYFDRARGEGNPLVRIYDALGKQKTFTEENRKAGNALAQKALVLEKQFGQRARDGWMIARDATLAGVDPSPGANNDHLGKNVANNVQRKAALARLQPEFAALPQEVRDYIHEVSKFYADQQDLKTKALIANILKGFEAGGLTQPLSVQAYAQLTTNTMEGKLTDADAAILDNETAFNALKNSSELRKVEGLYFPLMRHGKHVVRTTTALGELYGGVVGKPDANGDVEVRWEEGNTRKDVLAPYTKVCGKYEGSRQVHDHRALHRRQAGVGGGSSRPATYSGAARSRADQGLGSFRHRPRGGAIYQGKPRQL
jgi:hypothetical protein